jgi:hypothetical protein
LDDQQVSWAYEPVQIRLDFSTFYTPDFAVKGNGLVAFLELKPTLDLMLSDRRLGKVCAMYQVPGLKVWPCPWGWSGIAAHEGSRGLNLDYDALWDTPDNTTGIGTTLREVLRLNEL